MKIKNILGFWGFGVLGFWSFEGVALSHIILSGMCFLAAICIILFNFKLVIQFDLCGQNCTEV